MLRYKYLLIAVVFVSAASFAADSVVVTWPSESDGILKFTVSNFQKTDAAAPDGQINLTATVRVDNLWKDTFAGAFVLDLKDGEGNSIGDVPIWIDRVLPGKAVTRPVYFTTVGIPKSFSLRPNRLPLALNKYMPEKKVALTVRSTPAGATLKLDGTEVGVTPQVIEATVGVHKLELSLQGFQPTIYPLVVQPEETSGGSVTIELAGLGHDTIELRDDTVLTGDVQAMSWKNVTVLVDGKPRQIDRNQVKKITLVERASN